MAKRACLTGKLTSAKAAPSSHCTSKEKTVFSCTVKRGKMVSVCTSKNFNAKRGYIQYRYGRPGKVELQYPKSRKRSHSAFIFYASLKRGIEYAELSFSNGKRNYDVFEQSDFNQEEPVETQGVSVKLPSGKNIDINCVKPPKDSISSLEDLVKSTRH